MDEAGWTYFTNFSLTCLFPQDLVFCSDKSVILTPFVGNLSVGKLLLIGLL